MPTETLAAEIKKRMTQAMKDRDDVAKSILRLALGEIQTAEARANRALRDDEAVAILRKLVKSNEETLAASGDSEAGGEDRATLRKENAVLALLLPATMSVEQIAEALESQRDAIRAANSDGQATGVAMKHLKTTGAAFEGNDVAAAVKKLRQ